MPPRSVRDSRYGLDPHAAGIAAGAVVVLLVLVYVGSGGLRWFDAALAGYLLGTLLAVFATVYRYLVWLRRPPTARLNRRGWEAFRRRGSRGRNVVALGGLVATNLLAQGSSAAGRPAAGWPTSWCSGVASSPRLSRSR